MYNITLRCICATIVALEKQYVLHILSVCLLPSMQSTCALLCCQLWPLQLYSIFSHYLINGTIFRKIVIEHKMCVLSFSMTFVWNISYSKKNSARYNLNVHRSSCMVPVILVRFWWNLNFLNTFSKYTQISNLMKICLLGAELFMWTDRQRHRCTDIIKLIVTFTILWTHSESELCTFYVQDVWRLILEGLIVRFDTAALLCV
jgi:hypothetical protein